MIAEQVATYLDELNVGIYDTVGATGNIFLEQMPLTPDKVIAIYSTGAVASDAKLNYDTITIQIMVRGGLDCREAQSLAQLVYDQLHGFEGGYFVGGGFYIVSCLGLQAQPILLGKDANERFEYSLNFNIEFQNTDSRRRE